MLSTATPPVSVSAVLEGGPPSSSSTSSSPPALSNRASEAVAADTGTDAAAVALPSVPPGDEDLAPSAPTRASARREVIEILRGGPATQRKIADELNADRTQAHVAQGPLEALLKTLVDDGTGATVMLGDPQELHYRLAEAMATPAAVLERRAKILGTIACDALSSVVVSELEAVAAIEPADLDGLTLDGVIELAAAFFGFEPDSRLVVESDLAALVQRGALVRLNEGGSSPAPGGRRGPDDEDEDDEDGEDEDDEDEDEGDDRRELHIAPGAPSDVRYTFAKGKLADYLVLGGRALALLSMPEAVQASPEAPEVGDNRTDFERKAAKLLDEESDAHARTKGKLAKVYEWLKEKNIDTELLDERLDVTSGPAVRATAPAGTKVVMRKKRVPVEKADVVRLMEELNELANEERLLAQIVEDAQKRARDLVKSAKEAAARRGEELSSLRQDKVAAAKDNEMVLECRCRAEHDFVTNTVRYFDLATGELFDTEPLAAGPLFEPRVEGTASGAEAQAIGAPLKPACAADAGTTGTGTADAGIADAGTAEAPATTPPPVGPAGAAATEPPASAPSPAGPGFTKRAEGAPDAATLASEADEASRAAKAARIPRTGKKVAQTVQAFEIHASAVVRAAGAEGLSTSDLLPRVLTEAGLTEVPKGLPALVVVAEKNLKANHLVEERDGRLFWVGPMNEAPAPEQTPAPRGRGKSKGGSPKPSAAPRGKAATRGTGRSKRT